jgi:thiol-disulfide isomerase/thioredoxin
MTRLVYLFALVFGLMAGAGLMAGTSVAAEMEAMPSADPVFAATLADFDGKPVPLAELKGKLVVLNFWATWCGPCRTEIPHLIEAQEKYGPRGIVFIGAAVEDNADSVRDFGKAYGINYTVAMAGKDQGIALLRALGNKIAGLPFTIVLDRQGNIVAAKRGIMTPALMQQILDPLQ